MLAWLSWHQSVALFASSRWTYRSKVPNMDCSRVGYNPYLEIVTATGRSWFADAVDLHLRYARARIVVDVRRDPTITSDLVSTHHHMDTAQREFVLEIRAMLSIATHSFLAGSYRSTELSPGSETC